MGMVLLFCSTLLALLSPLIDAQAVMDPTYLWPDGIVPYEISSVYTASDADLIRKSLAEIETYSCVKFVLRTDESDYVTFTEYKDPSQERGTCWAGKWGSQLVGNQRGQHIISLWRDLGCFKKFEIIHEMMHILGFLHEQQRGDRDSYIYVNEANVNPAYRAFLTAKHYEDSGPEQLITYLGTSYDTDSIMHYHAFSFGKDSRVPTLSPKDPCNKIGNQAQLSPTDAIRLNRLYNCPAGKPSPPAVVRDMVDYGYYFNVDCRAQARAGQCTSDPMNMNAFCGKTCCDKARGICKDDNVYCSSWTQAGYCNSNPGYMLARCKKSCNAC